MRSRLLSLILLAITLNCGFADDKKPAAKDPSRVLPVGEVPKDARLGTPRSLKDDYHPWVPPNTLKAWEKERKRLREQVLISQGLWPMPPKTPLEAVVHGKMDRGDYTVEKVYFQSHPGHYVTGNLYRPKLPSGINSPGVLCPHGHWADARFYDAGVNTAKKLIAGGGETHLAAARHHIQARMVGLVRLGCVVFHYDMVGYSDSKVIAHRQGFTDAEASLRLQNFMGLQTWNSIRALDFLTSLPDVDTKRIGITGASGGGTQTFMLAGIDPRVTVAFPAVMVSTDMQGGCICENSEYLRIGVNNIALAALFAPKPQAMSGADDWTKNIETKGYPELRQVYSLYGKSQNIAAKAFTQYDHNYNRVAREMMYEWFNTHLKLGHESPIIERNYEPLLKKDLTVWTKQHPLPKDAKSATELKAYLTKVADEQFAKLVPKTKADVKRYREVVGAAARMMFGDVPEKAQTAEQEQPQPHSTKDAVLFTTTVSRKGVRESVPVLVIMHKDLKPSERMVTALWLHTTGKKHLLTKDFTPKDAVLKIGSAGLAVASADVFGTGEFIKDGKPFKNDVNSGYAGYTFGYNRPLVANRGRDLLTLNGRFSKDDRWVLIGSENAGPWALLAAARMKHKPTRIIVDLNGFSFRNLKDTSDPNFLPGALKYGGIGGLAALAAPTELVLYGTKGIPKEELTPLIQIYKVTGGKLTLHTGKLTDELVVKEVLKK